ncbi:MAG TPA: hypothetical protein VFW41_10115 [Gaiellaceae bacterium]|nr:hypothetical protein [Gaiellaceae bacterium]
MKTPGSALAATARRRLAVLGAVVAGTLAAAVPGAVAAYGPPVAPPANLPPTRSAAVISTAVNGRHVVRANLADKFTGDRFVIVVNGKVVARGRVHAKGRFVTWFKGTLARGTMVHLRVKVGTHYETVVQKRA